MHRLPLFALLLITAPALAAEPRKPNVVLILADDLGYGDLGCYGQAKIKTPHLDRLAKDGMRFTACYAGSTVCAPSRCALMTGLHTGHCRTRGNGGAPKGNVPLAPTDRCVAEVFKKAGYATALVGKWGLGEEESTGVPTKKGFDFFYGYLNQTHAHNYYPDYLIRNEAREAIPANVQRQGVKGVAEKPTVYAPDLLIKEAVGFVEANKDKPFFLYFATIAPHANNEKTRADKNGNEVPSDAPYTNEAWPQPERDKAAMITRMDADVGNLLAKLKELKLDDNTIVIFSSDNGPHKEGGNDPAFFRSSGPFGGFKRSLTDGGIRVPGIVRWPGVVKPGAVSEHVWAFWDFLPTVCDLLGEIPPADTDGLTLLPTLTGKGGQKAHEYLYWEFHEGGFKQAVRYGRWKGIKPAADKPVQLFDLTADVAEKTDVAEMNPAVVGKLNEFLKAARTESREFPVKR
jgi:arylsulfatase A-like enzyme